MNSEDIPLKNEILTHIREKKRIDIKHSQFDKRFSTQDRHRCGLSEINEIIKEQELLTEKDVQGLSSRIKRRKCASVIDLKRLSAAFLHDPKNIEVFSKVTGALNIVVKELSGTDPETQILACECLCNLALGDDICSKKVAQNAGSYLILYLDNFVNNKIFFETCLWTLQNLLLSGEKTRQVLMAQGLPDKLLSLLDQTFHDLHLRKTLQIIFSMMVVEGFKDLPDEFPMKVLNYITSNEDHDKSTEDFFALYTILVNLNFTVDLQILSQSVRISVNHLIKSISHQNSIDIGRCLILIEIITNCLLISSNVDLVSDSFVSSLIEYNCKFSYIVNEFLHSNNKIISEETLWMLSSLCLISSKSKIIFKYFEEIDNLKLNLRIPTQYL